MKNTNPKNLDFETIEEMEEFYMNCNDYEISDEEIDLDLLEEDF